jgi:hypothetical protein
LSSPLLADEILRLSTQAHCHSTGHKHRITQGSSYVATLSDNPLKGRELSQFYCFISKSRRPCTTCCPSNNCLHPTFDLFWRSVPSPLQDLPLEKKKPWLKTLLLMLTVPCPPLLMLPLPPTLVPFIHTMEKLLTIIAYLL